MSHLFELITDNKIRAVACQDEDRLFRDVTQIQVNIFIEACKQHQVLVITPSMVYDFAHPQMGTQHARQFRFKSEMAAEYIESYVRGRLLKSKRYLLINGRWGGPPMPSGYMADMRKELSPGVMNEHWRKFCAFEPYAEVVQEYFNIFIRCGRNLRKTLTHIEAHGPYFPNPVECQPPEGFKAVYRIRPYNGKYYPGSRTALRGMLTNAMYLGHWMLNGQIVIWNNHPPLIDEALFMRAFNTLSRITFSGEPNPEYQPLKFQQRPSKDEKRPKARPLCMGLMVSDEHGEWLPVGTNWVSPLQSYAYTFWSKHDRGTYRWSKAADYVDDMISQLLLEKLALTFDYDEWEKSVETFIQDHAQQSRVQQAQLQQLETVMKNLINSLGTLTNPGLIRAAEQQYEDAETEYARLQEQLASVTSQEAHLEEIKRLKSSYGQVLENWPKLSMDEKREVLHTFVDRIQAVPMPDHGLQLIIFWRDKTHDELRIPRLTNNGISWLPEEVDSLLTMGAQGALQIDIAREFPERTWNTISSKYKISTGKNLVVRPKPIRGHERYADYLERLAQQGLDPGGDDYFDSRIRWQEEETSLLIDLVERGEPQTDIAQNFPARPWRAIRDKYKASTGKRLVVNPKTILDHERYGDYRERIVVDSSQSNISGQQSIAGAPWQAADIELLKELVTRDAAQVEIALAFPYRTWKSIREKYLRETEKLLIPDPKPILSRETYTDYVARLESASNHTSNKTKAGNASFWQSEEVDTLLSMVEWGESQLAIARALPQRRWSKIVGKYRKLTGTRIPVECSHLHSYERYEDYVNRTQETTDIPDRNEWPQIPNAPWQTYEVDLLLEMVAQEEEQTAIAQTFPHRNWKAISGKYYQVIGETLVVEPKPIREHERFADYERRMDPKDSTTNIDTEVHSKRECRGGPD
ncbi:MAG: hypothetical protein R3A44_06335 [Caldilineaceae bacterium]